MEYLPFIVLIAILILIIIALALSIADLQIRLNKALKCDHAWKYLNTYTHTFKNSYGKITKQYDYRSYECSKCKKVKREPI